MKRTHEEIIEELRKRMEMYDKPEEECFIQGVITGLSISSNLVKDDEFLLSILENGKFYHFLLNDVMVETVYNATHKDGVESQETQK